MLVDAQADVPATVDADAATNMPVSKNNTLGLMNSNHAFEQISGASSSGFGPTAVRIVHLAAAGQPTVQKVGCFVARDNRWLGIGICVDRQTLLLVGEFFVAPPINIDGATIAVDAGRSGNHKHSAVHAIVVDVLRMLPANARIVVIATKKPKVGGKRWLLAGKTNTAVADSNNRAIGIAMRKILERAGVAVKITKQRDVGKLVGHGVLLAVSKRFDSTIVAIVVASKFKIFERNVATFVKILAHPTLDVGARNLEVASRQVFEQLLHVGCTELRNKIVDHLCCFVTVDLRR